MALKATIAVDDWKLPVFRKALEEGGYSYEDGGELRPGMTILTVPYTDQAHLTKVVSGAQADAVRAGRPK